MKDFVYQINKGVNRPIEFKGLKAQYIYYLAAGLAALLVIFSILYIAGIPVFICLPLILVSGSGLFYYVFRYSHRYGEHGLMKMIAYKKLPSSIRCRSLKVIRKIFTHA